MLNMPETIMQRVIFFVLIKNHEVTNKNISNLVTTNTQLFFLVLVDNISLSIEFVFFYLIFKRLAPFK